MTRSKYVPPGGAAYDGWVLTRKEVTEAVARYARRHNCYARTVRTMTVLFRSALGEYVAARAPDEATEVTRAT